MMSIATTPGVPSSVVEAAFPFFLAFDNDLRLTQVGRSLSKLCQHLVVGARLPDVCQIPGCPDVCAELQCLLDSDETGVPLTLVIADNSLPLQGQATRADDEVLFLGAPRFAQLREVAELGLAPSDFAPHDCTLERLEQEETLRQELAESTERLTRSRSADSRHFKQRLKYETSHDPITGLPNREGVLQAIEEEYEQGQPVALVFVDLDDFKRLNDVYGHEVGDSILRQVGRNLASAIRSTDVAGRLGGDEFALVLRGVEDPEYARRICNRLLLVACQQILVNGRPMQISGSVGIALSRGAETPIEMFRHADLAMYHAKSSRKGGTSIYSDDMSEALSEQVRVQHELEVGIPRGEVVPHYQPIVSLFDEQTVGVEALARWYHPERGLMTPAKFIDIAEQTGLVVDLGRRLLQAACSEVHSFNLSRGMPWSVSVNLSPRQVQEEGVVDMVAETLDSTGIPAEQLKLEITETTLFSDVSQASKVFGALSRLGVRVVLDDFGTGYSSMQYLRQFPIDTLKVDRSFVANIDQSSGTRKLVDSIVNFGLSMGLNVVAEGIERPEQAEMLRSIGCPLGQGFLFSKPTELSLLPG